MTQNASVSVVGPTAGEIIHLVSIQMRILEDGHITNHRFSLVESAFASAPEYPNGSCRLLSTSPTRGRQQPVF